MGRAGGLLKYIDLFYYAGDFYTEGGKTGCKVGELLQLPFIQLYGVFVTQAQGIRDEGMADGYLLQAGNILGKIAKVV